MRIRPALLAAIGLAACSAPRKTEPLAPRDLHVGTTAPLDAGVASDIEIGRSPKIHLPSSSARRHVTIVAAALDRDGAVAPKLAVTAMSVALVEPTKDFKAAPVPVEILAAASAPDATPTMGLGIDGTSHRGGTAAGGSSPGAGGSTSGGWRGGVIIRGGVGGTDDDCDIRHPHHGPMAVNRVGPSFRGGIR